MNICKQEFIRYLNENDQFCKHNGVHIVDVEIGYTRAEVVIEPHHLNAIGIAQGGLVYTLADFTLASASYRQEKIGVSMHCNISYFKQSKIGDRLVAIAREENRTRNTATYQVRIYAVPVEEEFVEENAKLIASFQGILGLLVPRPNQHNASGC